MLTSLNVVRMAAVDCDCSRRSATRWRRRDIGTRCSGRDPAATGTETTGGATGAGALATGAAAVWPASARASMAVMTSPFVTRPPRPVPSTLEGWTPWSAIILRAAGITVTLAPGVAAACGAGAGGATGLVWTGAAAVFAAVASESITAITSLDVTVEPSGFTSSTSTPSPGAGSSSTTLSVSTSIRFSSRFTASPGFLCQFTSVASATDSGNWGTFTSIRIGMIPELCRPSRC